MSAVSTNFSYNSSVASSQMDNNENSEIKKYVKDLLRSRIFLGRYMERRLGNQQIGYRDVVLLSAAETELKRDLIDVQNKLRAVYPGTHWVGITDGQHIGYSGILIWTEIENQPFGPFWFQIKSVKFRDDEVIITVKCLRHINEAFLEMEPILTGSTKKKLTSLATGSGEPSVAPTEVLSETYSEIVGTLKGALSIRNLKEFITFVCALVIAVFSGSTAFINFLGNFVLALVREMSFLIKNSTPLFLGFLDFLSKIVGGFYILMAMVFKPSNPVPVDRRSIAYPDKHRRSQSSHAYSTYDDSGFD